MVSDYYTEYKLSRPPAGLTATGSADGILLQWNSMPGIGLYKIYRSVSDSNSTFPIDEVYDTLYFDTPLADSRYYYRIAAWNGSQWSTMSGCVNGRIASGGPVLLLESVT